MVRPGAATFQLLDQAVVDDVTALWDVQEQVDLLDVVDESICPALDRGLCSCCWLRWWQGWHSGKDGGEEEQVVDGHLQVQTATGAKRRWNAGKAKGSGQTKLCVVPGPRDSPRTVGRGTGDACGIGSSGKHA